MTPKVRNLLIACALFVVLLIGFGILVSVVKPPTPKLTPEQLQAIAAAKAARELLAAESKDVRAAESLLSASLPTKGRAPAPAANGSLFKAFLRSHEVWNFLQYFDLASVTPVEISSSSAIVYSGLCVSSAGSIDTTPGECGDEADALASASFGDFVAEAHRSGTAVLLSLNAFDEQTIAPLLANPSTTAAALAAAVLPTLNSYGLNGVNLDIEGSNPAEAGAFVTFTAAFVHDVRASAPSALVMLDAYAGSASGAPNFFDVAALAPFVDRIFVEGYQMDDASYSSANAPIASSSLGYSVVQTIIQYAKVVSPSKLILGVPFYGLDFTTAGSKLGAVALSASPTTITYDAILSDHRKALWDPVSMTPYSIFRDGSSWHQLWFDDPVSIALKSALAIHLGAAGVGAWSLGMETSSTEMLQALTGGEAPMKLALAG